MAKTCLGKLPNNSYNFGVRIPVYCQELRPRKHNVLPDHSNSIVVTNLHMDFPNLFPDGTIPIKDGLLVLRNNPVFHKLVFVAKRLCLLYVIKQKTRS